MPLRCPSAPPPCGGRRPLPRAGARAQLPDRRQRAAGRAARLARDPRGRRPRRSRRRAQQPQPPHPSHPRPRGRALLRSAPPGPSCAPPTARRACLPALPRSCAAQVLTRRFFLVDALSGRKQGAAAGAPPDVVRYARAVSLSLRVSEADPAKVLPPLLTVEYAEALTAGGSRGAGSVPASFEASYSMELEQYWNSVSILLVRAAAPDAARAPLRRSARPPRRRSMRRGARGAHRPPLSALPSAHPPAPAASPGPGVRVPAAARLLAAGLPGVGAAQPARGARCGLCRSGAAACARALRGHLCHCGRRPLRALVRPHATAEGAGLRSARSCAARRR